MSLTLNWPNRDKKTGKISFFMHPNMVNINNKYSVNDMNESFRRDAILYASVARANLSMNGNELFNILKGADSISINDNEATAFDVRLYHQACLLGKNMTCAQLISIADDSASITINGDDDCTNYEVVFEGDAFDCKECGGLGFILESYDSETGEEETPECLACGDGVGECKIGDDE